jgi:tRNA-specific 2-thiouridylase
MNELQCDYLATGHYARIENVGPENKPMIITSCDDWKDQTYFLFTIDPGIIPRLMFPIGHLKKPEVRELAEKFSLLNARKKDSTGICFVGDKGYDRFIESQVSPEKFKSGVIRLYPTGEKLAKHDGIHHFTYGQRKGLGVYRPEPVYVIKIDSESGDVWVGDEKHLFADQARVVQPHFLDQPKDGERLKVKIRFQHKGAWARVKTDGAELSLQFEEPVRAVTPGQAAVMYRDNQLIGGGWIVG